MIKSKDCYIGKRAFQVTLSDDNVVVFRDLTTKTRLEVYECDSDESGEHTFNTIRDVLHSLSLILAN